MEGYLWDPPEAKTAFVTAAGYAHKAGRKTAFTLSDPFCVNRFRDEFLELMRSKTIDYVFANVEEVKALYQTDSLPVAIRKLSGDCTLAAVTMGAEGAMAITNGEIVSVPANAVPEVIDATGAGDLFAAGFLLGLSRERDLHAALTAGLPRRERSDQPYRRAPDARPATDGAGARGGGLGGCPAVQPRCHSRAGGNPEAR